MVLLVCWWINLTTSFHLDFGDLQSLWRILPERLFHSINRSDVVANLLSRKLEQKEGPALSRWPPEPKTIYCENMDFISVL